MDELLPCPFCGGAAEQNHTTTRWWVTCCDSDCAGDGPIRESEAEAVAAWNQRVVKPEPPQTEIVPA